MTTAAEHLARDPALYPMAFDLARDAILFLRMDEAGYRASSFLDERAVTQGGEQWIPHADVARAMAEPLASKPLHFIFHMGHVGSTLLSRLLDEAGSLLSLREPLPLRALAEAVDSGLPGTDNRLETMLRLWERGFADTRAVVLKATSATERLGPTLLSMRPQARAILLNVSAECFLATILAASNSAVDLNAHGPERMHRLGKLGIEVPRPTTLGELAAMSWLSERMTQGALLRDFGDRILSVDFDALLQWTERVLGLILSHFAVPQTPEQIARIARSPALTRYSKAPEHEYSPARRKALLDQARAAYAGEIGAALDWLRKIALASPAATAIL
ncbi:MAG TPA: hypothetical protein VMF58_00760 [Rhizomicrobium sp.]|nr:hypothetical protein [Rhizomicrobium sp.]